MALYDRSVRHWRESWWLTRINVDSKVTHCYKAQLLLYLTFFSFPLPLCSWPHSEGLYWWFHSTSLCRYAWQSAHRPTDAGIWVSQWHYKCKKQWRLDASARGCPLRSRLLCASPPWVQGWGGPAEWQRDHAATAGYHPWALQLRTDSPWPQRQHWHSKWLPAAICSHQRQSLILPHVPAKRSGH